MVLWGQIVKFLDTEHNFIYKGSIFLGSIPFWILEDMHHTNKWTFYIYEKRWRKNKYCAEMNGTFIFEFRSEIPSYRWKMCISRVIVRFQREIKKTCRFPNVCVHLIRLMLTHVFSYRIYQHCKKTLWKRRLNISLSFGFF